MCILTQDAVLQHQRIANKVTHIHKWLKQTQKQFGYTMSDTLFAMEFTGIYNNHLAKVLYEANAAIWLIPGILISSVDGLQRGKSDKQDALRIAEYAQENPRKIRLWKKPRVVLEELQTLLMVREKLMLTRHQCQTTLKEFKSYGSATSYKTVKQYSEAMLRTTLKEITAVEEEINKLIKAMKSFMSYTNILQA